MPTVLHVGCGNEPLPAWLDGHEEVRVDIDPNCAPHIVAPMTDLGDIGPFDVLYTSHCLEHLYPHQVSLALAEFLRVLKPGGLATIFVPDLEGIEATEAYVYESPAGPICGLDMIYGKRSMIEANPYMAHHCGFVRETLAQAIESAGFARTEVLRMDGHNLMAAAVKGD